MIESLWQRVCRGPVGSVLPELRDSLRALSDSEMLRLGSLGGAREFLARIGTGDFHPTIVWSLHAADRPDDLALVQGESSRTWRKANANMNRVGNALAAAGVAPGDRVAVMLENSIEWFEIMIGCQRIGAATVFVSYRSTPPEIAYLLDNSQAAVLFHGAAHDTVVRRALEQVTIPQRFAVRVGRPEATPAGSTSYADLLAGGSESEPPAALRSGGSRTILYTSGTTGKPKGAVRDLAKAGLGAMLGLLRKIPLRRSDRHLVAAPLYHATGSGFATISATLGSTVHVLERFDPEAFLAAVDREKITTSALVPTMLRALVELPPETRRRYDTSSLRVIVSTGSALPESLRATAIETLGDVLYDLYGSTEMAYVTVATPEDKRAAPGTIGRAFPGVEIVLLDDARKPVEDGEVGELYARSKLTVEGYHGNDAATRESRFGDYFSVGDLAVRDRRGYFTLVGRKKDMVISGGMNVYPAEIEAVLGAHPAIREAAVIGVPDEKWGEALVAFVAAREDQLRPSDDDLVDYAKQSLASYKVPRRFEWVDALPRNPTGKILKRELQERMATTDPEP